MGASRIALLAVLWEATIPTKAGAGQGGDLKPADGQAPPRAPDAPSDTTCVRCHSGVVSSFAGILMLERTQRRRRRSCMTATHRVGLMSRAAATSPRSSIHRQHLPGRSTTTA